MKVIIEIDGAGIRPYNPITFDTYRFSFNGKRNLLLGMFSAVTATQC